MLRRSWLAGGGALLAAMGVLASLGSGGPQPAHALTNCGTNTTALDGSEQQLLSLINGFRTSNGRAALKASPNLSRAAAWMSEDVAGSGVFSHTDSLGRGPGTRVVQCGYATSGSGENLALTSSAQSAFTLWMNSTSGHRENMLNPAWTVAGIGHAGNIWAADFGALDDSSQPWDSGSGPPAATSTPTPRPTGGGGAPPPGVTTAPSAPPPGGATTSPSTGDAPAPGIRTTIPSTPYPQYKLPSNVPVKRAMLQMLASE